jgi:hypothetical protein
MRNRQAMGAVAGLVLSMTASMPMAREQGKIEPLPQDLEIQLALSALPRHLRDNATVYTLDPAKGFEVARAQAISTPLLHVSAMTRSEGPGR